MDPIVEDLMWSDPVMSLGDDVEPNFMRHAGTLFGPAVAKRWLKAQGFRLLIRSHQCVADGWQKLDCGEGYELITVFSASNYGGSGNYGAVLTLQAGGVYLPVQWEPEAASSNIQLQNKKELVALICKHKKQLRDEFKHWDMANAGSGVLTETQWVKTMQDVLQLSVNWHVIRPTLVDLTADGGICYESFLDRFQVEVLVPGGHHAIALSSTSTNFFNCSQELQAVLQLIDSDHSGTISMEEMRVACDLINPRLPPAQHMKAEELFALMDRDGNGEISLEEFVRDFSKSTEQQGPS